MHTTTYLVQLFAGLLPFLAFSDGLLNGSGAVLSNRAVLLNTVYPAELVSVRAVLSGHAVAALGLVLVAGFALATGHPIQGLPLLPLVLVLQIMFVCGVSWPLSLANLVLRDIQQILTFLCTALMIVSPIAYAPDAAPGPLKLLVYLNPVSYFVLTCQSLAVTGTLPPTQANFVWLPLGPRTADFVAQAAEARIVVRPYGTDGVRVTVGAPEENDALLGFARDWILRSSQ